MKQESLHKLLYSSYLKTTLFSILIIEVALLVLYFSVNNYNSKQQNILILQEVQNSVSESLASEAQIINNRLKNITQLAYMIQTQNQDVFLNPQKYPLNNNILFAKAHNNVFYKTTQEGSSVMVSKETKITKEFYEKLLLTEHFDLLYQSIVEQNEYIVAAYFNSFDNLNRYYPFIDQAYNLFPADIKMQNYNFYYEADEKHNPDKKVVWTDTYLDPAGQGWMVSAIAPIYNNTKLEGVSGLDVTINVFINKLLNLSLPYQGKSLILDNKGSIIAMQSVFEELLERKELTSHNYHTAIKHTIFKPNEFNLLKHENKSIQNTFETILEERDGIIKITLQEEAYYLFYYTIPTTKWRVVSFIKEQNILKNSQTLIHMYEQIGYVAIALMIIFYLVFFFFLAQLSHSFANRIVAPLKEMLEATELNHSYQHFDVRDSGIEEFDNLNHNLASMIQTLKERNEALEHAQENLRYNEQLANTDPLTGAFNRRFLFDAEKKLLAFAKREKMPFSLLVFDIDNFKAINDNYGHSIGDDILKQMVASISNLLRENDLIVRMGGDEFLVVLPTTTLNNAKIVAKKIHACVESVIVYHKSEMVSFTISMGLTAFKEKDGFDEMIKRADMALYEAKGSGRNQTHSL